MFIVLEGIDGVGKTTMTQKLSGWFHDNGYIVKNLREPGTTVLGEKIRSIIKDSTIGPTLSHYTLALLMNAARSENCLEINDWLESGGVVIADRFALSTLAYQGTDNSILDVTSETIKNTIPDLTIILDADPKDISSRLFNKDREDWLPEDKQDWLDLKSIEEKEKIRDVYKIYGNLSEFSRTTVIINANEPEDMVFNNILSVVLKLKNTHETLSQKPAV